MIFTRGYLENLNPNLQIEDEEWRPTKYDNIEVSNWGNIRRLATTITYRRKDIDKLITRHIPTLIYNVNFSEDGYAKCIIWKNKELSCHRQVALAFIPNFDEDKVEVDHIDYNPGNPYYKNLQWVTPSENRVRSYKHVLIANGRPVVDIISGKVYPSITKYAETFDNPYSAEQCIRHALSNTYYYVPKYDILVKYLEDELKTNNVSDLLMKCRIREIRKIVNPGVKCINTGIIYPNAYSASKYLDLPPSCVSEVLEKFKGYYKKKNLKFEYIYWKYASDSEIIPVIPYFIQYFKSRKGGRKVKTN